jgi:hypothetical protein
MVEKEIQAILNWTSYGYSSYSRSRCGSFACVCRSIIPTLVLSAISDSLIHFFELPEHTNLSKMVSSVLDSSPSKNQHLEISLLAYFYADRRARPNLPDPMLGLITLIRP